MSNSNSHRQWFLLLLESVAVGFLATLSLLAMLFVFQLERSVERELNQHLRDYHYHRPPVPGVTYAPGVTPAE